MDLDTRYAGSPTPSQIRMGCRQFQAAWSPDEERLRRTGTNEERPIEVPMAKMPAEMAGKVVA